MAASPQHRRRKTRDHRRGKSIEEISREELLIIVDETDIDKFGIIDENHEEDELLPAGNANLNISVTSIDGMEKMIEEVSKELEPQYPTPPRQPAEAIYSSPSHVPRTRMKRSDSHYKASTPLVVKKYTNVQLDSLSKNKKPRLMNANDNLPLLDDIEDEEEQKSMLLEKLSLCEVLCDFRLVNGLYEVNLGSNNEDYNDHDLVTVTIEEKEENDEKIGNEIKCIENKKLLLRECTKWLTKKKWSSIFILQQIFRVVQTNLFRSIPDGFIIAKFQGVDKPTKYSLPSWCHLQLIYELFFQLIMNKTVDKTTLETYLSGKFLNNFVQLFHSLSKEEVDYVKILLHSIYLDFPTLRDEIRISISQYCWDFIYCDNGTPEGINAILDIMNSILQGLDDDKLNDPDKWYIVLCHVLCPLHKGSNFDKFEVSLYKCIQTFIKSQPEHFVVVYNYGLLRFWPQTNPTKEHIFVKEILNILKMVKRKQILCDDRFNEIFLSVITRIQQNLLSKHYKIVEETIESFKDKLVRQCIDFHGGEDGWKGIYKSLIHVTNHHYLYLTRDACSQIMDWLKKYRITKKYVQVFEKLESDYTEKLQQEKEKQEKQGEIGEQSEMKKRREQKWKSILIIAQNAKTKLLKEDKEEDNVDDMKQSESIEDRRKLEDKLARAYMPDIVPSDYGGESQFTYPDSAVSTPLNESLLSPIMKRDSESLPGLHRKLHSEPVPNANVSTPKVVHKKRASQMENDYGYPKIHQLHKQYKEEKSRFCKSPSQLVLFAKKNAMEGVTYANTNKYYKARKAAIEEQRKQKKTKRKKKKRPTAPKPIKTTSVGTPEISQPIPRKPSVKRAETVDSKPAGTQSPEIRYTTISPRDNVNIARNEHASKYRRKKRAPSVESPIISAIKREKKAQQKSEDEMMDFSLGSDLNGDLDGNKAGHIKKKSAVDLENISTMMEIKEDEEAGVSTQYPDSAPIRSVMPITTSGVHSSPSTPASIKSTPVETPSFWMDIDQATLDLNSLVADNDLSLKD